VCSGANQIIITAETMYQRGEGQLRRLKYMLATATMIIVTLALTAMIVLQILDIKQLTLKQVGTAILTLTACASIMGGEKK